MRVNIVIFCLNNTAVATAAAVYRVCVYIGVSVGSFLFDYFHFYLLSRNAADVMKINKKQLP